MFKFKYHWQCAGLGCQWKGVQGYHHDRMTGFSKFQVTPAGTAGETATSRPAGDHDPRAGAGHVATGSVDGHRRRPY